MRPLVDVLDRAVKVETAVDPFQRDAAFVARVHPLFHPMNLYFGTEFRGWENLPAEGPFLVVGNHSGGAESNDFWFLFTKWVAERGADAPLYALAYDLLFAYPVMGPMLRRLGAVPATRRNARRALAMGAAVVVFPGGDYEAFRPWRERNRIDFDGRTGFVEVALEAGVPVVPMTIHGAHQSTFVLTRGRLIARLLGTDRLHVNVFPLVWTLPFGLAPAFVPSVQLPAQVTIEIGRPLDWTRAGAADDPTVVRRCYEEITSVMQATLEGLARELPYPLLCRLRALVPRWGSAAVSAGRPATRARGTPPAPPRPRGVPPARSRTRAPRR
jgi:1-acyl-sn-glycerol-3-phosphate acyltransferase